MSTQVSTSREARNTKGRTRSGPCAAIFRAVFSDLFLAFKMWVIWGVGAIKSASLLLHEVWLVKRRKFGRAIAL